MTAPIEFQVLGKPQPAGSKRAFPKCVGNNIKSESSLARLCRLQGLPEDFGSRLPFTVTAACKAVGNGVTLPMGRAIAKAVMEATNP